MKDEVKRDKVVKKLDLEKGYIKKLKKKLYLETFYVNKIEKFCERFLKTKSYEKGNKNK